MGTGSGRRGRRDNGLVAAEYAVAGDVDPRVGEHLLDVLAAGGIAAYLQPAADLHPVTRTTTLPARPTDRLYVDREHLDTARDYLAQVAESSPAAGAPPVAVPATTAADRVDFDAEFARIVAEFNTATEFNTDVGRRREPGPQADRNAADLDTADLDTADPDTADPDTADPDTADPDTAERRGREVEPSLLDALDTFGADLPDDDQDSYTPPPPPPLPRLSSAAVVSVLAVVGGFVLFLSPSLLPLHEDLVRMLGFAGCAAGVVGLIWRLRPGDEDDEYRDPDDGAQV